MANRWGNSATNATRPRISDLSMVPSFGEFIQPVAPDGGSSFPTPSKHTIAKLIEEDSSSEEEITIEYIIKKKPSTKTVRGFMRANLDTIESEEQRLFG